MTGDEMTISERHRFPVASSNGRPRCPSHHDERFRAAARPPLRPAAFFWAVVPPWLVFLLRTPDPDFLPPRLEAPGEFAIFAARSFDIPFSFRASYCFSFFTLGRSSGTVINSRCECVYVMPFRRHRKHPPGERGRRASMTPITTLGPMSAPSGFAASRSGKDLANDAKEERWDSG